MTRGRVVMVPSDNRMTKASISRDIDLLRGLHNLISSSTHSGVVQRHVKLRTLGSATSNDEKSVRLKSHWEFQGRD